MSVETLPEARDLAAYHNDAEYESQSRLKVLDESPALYHGRFIAKSVPFRDTPDMKLGRCLHVRVLQPDLFSELCPIMPAFEFDAENVTKDKKPRQTNSKTTEYYQTKKREFERDNSGRDIINAEELVLIRDMHNAIWRHEDAHAILSSSDENEVVHRWDDRIKRRCMMDAPRPGIGVIADIKTVTGPPTTLNFARNAAKWRWWMQDAWYRRGAGDLYRPRKPFRFVFICVNKKEPHEVACHELDDRPPKVQPWMSEIDMLPDLEWANYRTEQLVGELMERRETDIWEASFQRGINKVPLPRFVRSTFYDCEETDGD